MLIGVDGFDSRRATTPTMGIAGVERAPIAGAAVIALADSSRSAWSPTSSSAA
jgi:hypothetical protein